MESVKEARGKPRKRKLRPENWKKNISKRARYTAKQGPIIPNCGHNSKRFKCSLLSHNEIEQFHNDYYRYPDKIKQDNFLLKFASAGPVARRRKRRARRGANRVNKHNRKMSAAYFIKASNNSVVPVCRKTFQGILNVKKHRLEGVLRRFLENGEMAREKRGGDHRSFKNRDRQTNIINFIKKFPILEKHYCRGKSERQYLSSDLSITKMWKMYQNEASENMRCKQSYFRTIFNTKFNIGFNAPQIDVCSQCLEYKEKIKLEKIESEKVKLMTLQRVHKLRANAFFDLLKETNQDLITISFDCQKNLVLPKIPDQITYCKRQLYLYNFTAVVGSSQTKLTKDRVFIHTWFENESAKGSNEISSAIYDVLRKLEINETVKEIRLISDGCAGQNKNSILVAMCARWFEEAPKNIKKIVIGFPVTGHSFLPPDRVFAFIERRLKKKDTIIEPASYYEVFQEYGTQKILGIDWHIYDWKNEAKKILKTTDNLPFKIKSCKRIIFTKSRKNNVLVRGEPNYKNDVNNPGTICKKNRKISDINPKKLPLSQIRVKPKKLEDVDELLTKHFGEDWQNRSEEFHLEYYKNVLKPPEDDEDIIQDDEEQHLEIEESDFENDTVV